MSRSFDVVVIGAGPGGYPAAIRASQLGLSTACVERELLGGVCLNWGCIPSKALLKTAEMAHKMRHATDYGLSVGEVEVDFDKVIKRSRKVSKRFTKGVGSLFKKYGVNQVPGTGRLLAPGQVEVTDSDGNVEIITAKHIIIATGARARTFPGIEADGDKVQTYREFIVDTRLPKSCVVLGAGAIGMEFAYFLNAMGTDVTVVEGQDEVLPVEDRESGKTVRRSFEKQGVTFELNTFVDNVQATEDGVQVHLKTGKTLTAERALIALGIRANVEGLGLEDNGVALERGLIKVDTSYQTSVPGVYAVGDVCSLGPALAHTATRQAHVCVERIAGHHAPDVDYGNMPGCTYCQPQVASIGLTEDEAKKTGVAYKLGKFPFIANGKAQGSGSPEGFVKVLIGEEYGEILGAHIVGADATEMIANFGMARSAEATAELFITTVHAHPTFSEAMMEAVANALGESVHI